MKRVESGVEGLDKLIGGGIPESHMVLLSGPVGTGKTVFGLQFLCNGKEHGIFASFEEELDRLRQTAASFGWDIDRMERAGKIRLVRYDPYKFEDVIDVLENNIRETEAKRVVVDSISALGMYVNDASELRRVMLHVGLLMKKKNCTSIVISEARGDGISRFGVEEFVSDGVIFLNRQLSGKEYERHMNILKMRSSDHSRLLHGYAITKNGIVVR